MKSLEPGAAAWPALEYSHVQRGIADTKSICFIDALQSTLTLVSPHGRLTLQLRTAGMRRSYTFYAPHCLLIEQLSDAGSESRRTWTSV